ASGCEARMRSRAIAAAGRAPPRSGSTPVARLRRQLSATMRRNGEESRSTWPETKSSWTARSDEDDSRADSRPPDAIDIATGDHAPGTQPDLCRLTRVAATIAQLRALGEGPLALSGAVASAGQHGRQTVGKHLIPCEGNLRSFAVNR